MPSKEVARSIHEKIALFHLAASGEFAPKAIDYTASDEGTGYIDDTPDSYFDNTSERSMILGNVIGHRSVR